MLIEALLRAYRRVSPPVATMVAFAAIGTAVPVDTCIAWAPTQAPSLSASSVTSRSPTRCTSGMRCTRARKVFETAGPVLRKSTYTQRLRSWPGAWTCARCPSLRAQPMPHSSISRMRAGPCSQSRPESAGSQRPRPAFRVSARWCSQWSGSSSPTATATVICAITVAPPRPIRLRSTSSTFAPARAAVMAAYMPAAPDPITSTSACSIPKSYEIVCSGGRCGQSRSRRAIAQGMPRLKMGKAEATATATPMMAIMKLNRCDSFAAGSRSTASLRAARNATVPMIAARPTEPRTTRLGMYLRMEGNVAASPGPFKALLLFDRLRLDGVELVQADQGLDLLAGVDALLLGEAGVAAGAPDFAIGELGEMEARQQVGHGVDRRLVADVGELVGRRQRAAVAVAAADDVDQRDARLLRRLLHFRVVAREEEAEVGAGIGGEVDARHRLLQALDAAGIGARDDHEVRIGAVALPAGEADLVGELLARHRVRDVLVIVRALGVELVLDVHAGDAGADALAHGAHGVQRLAEAGAAVDHERDVDRRRHVARGAQLLVHGEQRLRGAARSAGDEAAGVDAVEAEALQQPPAERIVGDRHVHELLLLQQTAQRGGFLHGLYSRDER